MRITSIIANIIIITVIMITIGIINKVTLSSIVCYDIVMVAIMIKNKMTIVFVILIIIYNGLKFCNDAHIFIIGINCYNILIIE